MSFSKQIQEHVFVLGLVVLAFLYRESPSLSYPYVLYTLLGLLCYNLFQHWYLARTKSPAVFHAASVVINTLIVGAVVRFSGGKDSALWVLFLLPLFSSVLQETRTAALTLVLSLVMLGSFYLDWPVQPDIDLFTFATKAAVLGLAAYFTVRTKASEQKVRAELEDERVSLKRLEGQVESMTLQSDKLANLGALTTSIAHDLNGPIAVVLGYCDILLADTPAGTRLREDLSRIRESAQFCRNLVTNILGLARREDLSFVPTSIRDVFDSTTRLCQTQFRHLQVSLLTEFEEGLPDVPMSPVHIQQVLLNLLTNACHVSAPGGTVRVAVRRENGSGGVRVEIYDQGPGLTPGAEEKLFQPFYTTKAKGAGTGLGLYISRRIVEHHHGRIEAGNAPKGGAVFRFTLPAASN